MSAKKIILGFAIVSTLAFAETSSNDEVLRYETDGTLYTNAAAKEPNTFSIELGVGYVNAHFTGEQSSQGFMRKLKSHASNGVDIFVNGIYQPTQYFGFSFGLLWEFLPIQWQGSGLIEPETVKALSGVKYNSSEFIWNAVFTLGIISDIYKDSSNSVRLFANIGAGTNYLFGGSKYEGEASSFSTTSYESTTQIIPLAFALPVNFGVRFTFAKAHGIELVGKYELIDKTYDYKYPSQTITTTISRDMSFGLRYVYRFWF